MKNLLLTAAFVAAPALAQPSAAMSESIARICGSMSNLAVAYAVEASSGMSFRDRTAHEFPVTGSARERKTAKVLNAATNTVVTDAYYQYSTMEPNIVRSLSYSKCQIMLMDLW